MRQKIFIILFLGFFIFLIPSMLSSGLNVGLAVDTLRVNLNLGEETNKDISGDNETDLYLKLQDISDDNAFILVSKEGFIDESEMTHLILGVGDTIDVDINSDGYSDFNVGLIYISNTSAEVFVEEIIEPVFSPEFEENGENFNWLWVVGGVVLIVILFVIIKKF